MASLEPSCSMEAAPSEVRRIGGELRYYDVAANGDVVVVDRFRERIHFLPRRGAPRSFSRKGEGPGEFQRGGPIELVSDHVVMGDGGRIAVWRTDGTYVGSAATRVPIQLFQWGPGTVALTQWDDSAKGRGVQLRTLSLPGLEVSEPLLRTLEFDPRPDTICGGCDILRVDSSVIATTSDAFGTIRMLPLDGTDGSRTVQPVREREPWPSQRWEREIRRGLADMVYDNAIPGLSRTIDLDREVSPPGLPMRVVPHGDAIGVDGDRNLWVLINQLSDSTLLEVYDTSLDPLAEVWIPSRHFEGITVEGGWLLGLEFDELDRPHLWRYELPTIRDVRRGSRGGG